MRKKGRILFVIFLLIGCAEMSLAKSLAPRRTEAFSFVVMGDNRPRSQTNTVQPEVFYEMISEVNLLDPDFAMLLGDLIFGYSKSPYRLRRMWDGFDKAVKTFTVPYYLIIGNHDISNPAMQKEYYERYGKEFKNYYSFNHHKSHFIVLDSEVVGNAGYITGKQLTWLKRDLKRNRTAEHIFVFMHRPLEEGVEPSNWMRDIHPLMVKYHVDTVFAGHWHVYQKMKTRDGVRYIITGGAGAPIGNSSINGSFFHYILVTVRGKKTNIAIIKPGNIKNEEYVNQTTIDNTDETTRELTTILLPKNIKQVPDILNLVVSNRFDMPITGVVNIAKTKNAPWEIKTNNVLNIAPGKTAVIPLKLTKKVAIDNLQELHPLPMISWRLNIGEFTFNTPYNKKIKLTVDDWPYDRDVELLKEKSISISPVTINNNISGNITVVCHNPLLNNSIVIKNRWYIPKKSAWKFTSDISSTCNLEPGETKNITVPFYFSGNYRDVFPLPRIKTKILMKNSIVLESIKRLPVLAEKMFLSIALSGSATRTDVSPVIDGNLNDTEWLKADKITDFILQDAAGRAYQQTEVKILYDSTNMYIYAKCRDNDVQHLKLNARKKDGAVFNDDSLEILINTANGTKTYYHFAINANGLIYDAVNDNKYWNSNIIVKTDRGKKAWTLEVAIPLKDIKLKEVNAGDTIRMNFIRNKMHEPVERSQWAPSFKNKYDPDMFGIIRFE